MVKKTTIDVTQFITGKKLTKFYEIDHISKCSVGSSSSDIIFEWFKWLWK